MKNSARGARSQIAFIFYRTEWRAARFRFRSAGDLAYCEMETYFFTRTFDDTLFHWRDSKFAMRANFTAFRMISRIQMEMETFDVNTERLFFWKVARSETR